MIEIERVIAWLEAATNRGANMTVKEASELLEDLYQVQLFVNSVKDGKEQLLLALRRLP